MFFINKYKTTERILLTCALCIEVCIKIKTAMNYVMSEGNVQYIELRKGYANNVHDEETNKRRL